MKIRTYQNQSGSDSGVPGLGVMGQDTTGDEPIYVPMGTTQLLVPRKPANRPIDDLTEENVPLTDQELNEIEEEFKKRAGLDENQ
ncbi:MAG: hypothetical protein EZS28_028041 [Streblomastix strix]|uniref:Uncharacterized protein n=1 Tax=Streblomastix strix TaxID=222440 RepID=A0A5J4V2X4_9EUKA|nr:MAG: hypothetical protein EZS28_028041 [Streblomastix strix]